MKTLTLNSRISRREQLHSMDIDEATVIANRSGGNCYGVELIGRRIWQLLDHDSTVAELCELLLQEYAIDRETCEREVLEFLNDSVREDLIQTVD